MAALSWMLWLATNTASGLMDEVGGLSVSLPQAVHNWTAMARRPSFFIFDFPPEKFAGFIVCVADLFSSRRPETG
jgi:hypothetical protein